jgi:hypothetical protein
MRQARQKLEDAQRDGAVKDQEDAIAELDKAIAELEEILRQLREEEMERVLADLERRFRKMLKMQTAVYDATVTLDEKPADRRDRSDQIEASRLAGKEAKIVAEADKAMVLLREDGTSVALPEALAQLREDMESVMVRLDEAKTGQITQGIERDIIEALQEIIAALEKAQQDLKDQQNQPGGQPGQPGDPPLVDMLAELKMIRSLQMRVNRRTGQYQKIIEVKESTAAELLPKIQRLAERQDRIENIARDIVLGKNK